MLYSGHFSFDEQGTDNQEKHGYFSCLVGAETAEEALMKFKSRIRQLKAEEKNSLFDKILNVYVEDLVEISSVPVDAVVTRFQSSEGRFPKSESCTLPASDTTKITPYEWRPDDAKKVDEDGYKIAVPFLEF